MNILTSRIVLVFLFLFPGTWLFAGDLLKYTITSGGIARYFYVHTPPNTKTNCPVLMVFHGGGGTAWNAEKQFGFSQLADMYGYLLVYPQGMNKQWNDGRLAPAKGEQYDDIQFVRNILDYLPDHCPQADTMQVFSTGISNGGFFSFYLAYKLSSKIKAIAPVCASIPKDLETSFTLPYPVPMLYFAGTADPLVKYQGGWVGFSKEDKGRGYSMPVEWTLKRWLTITGTEDNPVEVTLPDMDKNDGCRATKYCYYRNEKLFIGFIKIENGGHCWPGGSQYLPKALIGNLCMDFSASEMIIRFFDQYRK